MVRHFSGGLVDEYKAIVEARGFAKALLRVLEMRFGELTDGLRERIATAGVGSLEMWFDRAIDSHDLNSVFESRKTA
jgi:hypothetical protein